MNLLAKYTERARSMTTAQLHYALLDIVDTEAFKGRCPDPAYTAKIMAEFDAYSTEKYRRQHPRRRV